MTEQAHIAKILVIGDVCTGKTSVIKRYVHKVFDSEKHPTIGVDFALKRVRIADELLNVQLWDIAGQERFIGLAPTYYKHACAALVVFDITTRQSLENARRWKADVDGKVYHSNGDNIPVVLFANKWDLVDGDGATMERCHTDQELDDFCRQNNFIGWFSTSAKTGLNIRKGMNFVINEIVENRHKMDAQPEEKDPGIIQNLAGGDDAPPQNSSGCC